PSSRPTPDPHSFPTRRSSDLNSPSTAAPVAPPAAAPKSSPFAPFDLRRPETAVAPLGSWLLTAETNGQLDLFNLTIPCTTGPTGDRKSTRLNSSHLGISYAVF